MALLTDAPPPPIVAPPPWWLEQASFQKPAADNLYIQEITSCINMDTHTSALEGNERRRLISPVIINRPPAEKMKECKKRPAQLVIPAAEQHDMMMRVKRKDLGMTKEVEVVKGRDFFLARKKGSRREVMEDRHGVILDIAGDPKQAFFAVIDGHGGDAAAEYVAENLGKNIVKELELVVDDHENAAPIEAALRRGYFATDKHFRAHHLQQQQQEDVNNGGGGGGACAAGVILKDGEVHVANLGDCKVVLSRKGKAIPLTNDHRLSRDDERARIQNSGGFLYCENGIWRLNGSLAVSRAFGDIHLKYWIISEPEIVEVPLTTDCQFLILASDGLWDKVSDQEAVDVVLSNNCNLPDSCEKLVDMSSSRGNRDDITVMTINLENFKLNHNY